MTTFDRLKERKIKSRRYVVFSLVLGGMLLVGLLTAMNKTSRVARAAPGDLFVTTGGGGDCSQATPCALHTALSQASNNCTIYVAQGTYAGTGGAVLTVTKSITFYGGWDGTATTPIVRDPDIYPTRLNGENTRQVVFITANTAPTINGFVITGGKGKDGGGIHVVDASPVIQNNIITANWTIDSGSYADGRGGGVFVGGIGNAAISQNRILSNTSGYGGGIYHDASTAITITGNEIVNNYASYRGGGILIENAPDVVQTNVLSGNLAANDGGAMLIWHAAPQVAANRIVNNSSPYGGGMSLGNAATPNLTNNLLISNTHHGLAVGGSSPVIVNNTIVGSSAQYPGNGVHLQSSSGCSPPNCATPDITNNIVSNYEIGVYGLGSGPVTPAIDYNDVWGNTTANYSLQPGVTTGTHNISLDPLFVDPGAGDYHLQIASPCINAGDPAGVPPAPPSDIDGDRRPFGIVDIGADEIILGAFLPVVMNRCTP
jgi:parallel beta-helix repeat protein